MHHQVAISGGGFLVKWSALGRVNDPEFDRMLGTKKKTEKIIRLNAIS